jgi:imidazolonepropionase-like amidohydrolase
MQSVRRIALATTAILVLAAPARTQDPQSRYQVIDGAILVDGTGAPPVPDAVVVIRGDRIQCVGPRNRCRAPASATRIDARGMWLVPGLVDAHVHFGQSGWFDARPDAANLQDQFPYPEVAARLASDPERFGRAYVCAGVTSVFDVGGYPWSWNLRQRFAGNPSAPRVAAAGPLFATIPFGVELPSQHQFVFMADSTTIRRGVAEHAAFKTDAVKIWYIMPPQPPDTARMQALVRLVAAEAHARGIRVIVHATGLWEAKDALRAGADVLVHSVFESPVDDEFIALARERAVSYVPTLVVYEGYLDASQDTIRGSRYPLECVDSLSRRLAANGPPPAERLGHGLGNPEVRARLRDQIAVAQRNAKRVHDAGITVAVGTDAGNPGTFHGPAIYREVELLQQAGFTPAEVLVAATRNGARALGRESDLGTLEAGKFADLLLLRADPTADIRNFRAVYLVMKGGVAARP